MGKIQKRIAMISIILITILAAALALFLWIEEKNDKLPDFATKEDMPDNEKTADKETGGGQKEETGEEVIPKPEGEVQEVISEQKTGSLLFTGDIMLGESVRGNYDAGGINGILSENLLEELQQADVTMVNEEFPFSNRGTPAPDKQFTFRIEPSYIRIFKELGVDVVSLANNHALDYGTDALSDTFTTLTEAGIPYVGAGDSKEQAARPVYAECQGKTVGILAASRVIPEVSWNIENQQPGMLCTYDSGALTAAIEETRSQCDYLVVYVHWGIERQEYPEEYQRSLAKAYIDVGADLVVGTHPHVPQGIEFYQGKPIIYSLGNFIFNANMADTYIVKVSLEAEEEKLQVLPVTASGAFTGELEGAQAQEMFRYIERISYDIVIDEKGFVSEKTV